jgi:hypothetical protein
MKRARLIDRLPGEEQLSNFKKPSAKLQTNFRFAMYNSG